MPDYQAKLSLEKARVRDLLNYYTPKKEELGKPHGSLLEHDCLPVPAIDAVFEAIPEQEQCEELQILGGNDGPSDTPSKDAAVAAGEDDIPADSDVLSHDPTLMAFTQLAAYRLNCQRSFISLMDGKHQYIIAEATRTVSINDPEAYDESDPGEKVYLGARILDIQWGVCPNTIQVFTALDDSLNLATDLVTANQQCYVMNDLSAIAAYADRPYVAGWPHMRFYAEVPIYSPSGFVIGTFCVVDDKPRDGLNKQGLDALNEISSAIMNYLALVRTQRQLHRAGEMVKGLNLFVEGKSDTPPQWLNRKPSRKSSKRRPSYQKGTVKTVSSNSAPQVPSEPLASPLPRRVPTPASSVADEGSDLNSVASNSISSNQAKTSTSSSQRERKLSMDDLSAEGESLASAGTKTLFSRASHLIRKAIDLDGTLLIDACFRDIAVESSQSVTRLEQNTVRFKGMPDTPDNDRTEWLNNPTRVVSNLNKPFLNQFTVSPDESESLRHTSVTDVLGYSLRDSAVLSGLSSSSNTVSLSQSTLRSLLRHYRHGHIFVFEDDGTLAHDPSQLLRYGVQKRSHPDLDPQPLNDADRERETSWARQLTKICVGAKAIIFFPLWDPQRDQWFAGGLAWTNDITRTLTTDDITYLSAFGSCIMTEKSRLDALTADRAKADFISSVSHELRSPLHGVLASAEALQETSTGYTQDDMIRTITVCGEVLLDTMDQILDYAKMSNSKEPNTKDGQLISRNPATHALKTTGLDLTNLVESVVEGIFAGHSYRKAALVPYTGQKSPLIDDTSTFTTAYGDILVILSMDWQESWILQSQVGGWKRILMNLFGNALKYTESGFVHISLRATQNTVDNRTDVTLQIDDSGRGMSKDYMKYELFTPFAQEDHLSVGTGLGLSIVRQLVTDLGGTIDIQSEKGYGTSAKVSVSLTQSEAPDPDVLEYSSMIADTKTRCKGLTVCMVGFEYYPDIGDTPTGILSSHAQRMLALRASISSLIADWFGITMVNAASLNTAKGDILIGLQSKLDFADSSWKGRPLIAFGDVGLLYQDDEKGIFALSQPVGPQKMARVLGQCLAFISSVNKLKADEKSADYAQINGMPSASGGSDLASLIEDINHKSAQALQIINSGSKVPNQSASAMRLTPSGSTSSQPLVTVQEITQQLERTVIASPEKSQRKKVLLVEDNVINMKILMNYMKNAKHEYVTAVNGLEALQFYQEAPHTFKVVFMDISMPVMDGLTSTRQMRLYEMENQLPRTRIVALTCFSSAEYQKEAMLSGIDLFLIKPVPMKTLKPILDLDPDVVAAVTGNPNGG